MLLRDENSGFLHFTCPLVGPKSYELGSTIPLGVSVRGASTKNKLKNITLRCLTENFETTFIERSVKNPIWEGAPFRWGTFVAPVRARPTYTPAHVLIVIWDRRPYGPVQACQEMWRSWALMSAHEHTVLCDLIALIPIGHMSSIAFVWLILSKWSDSLHFNWRVLYSKKSRNRITYYIRGHP